MELVKTHQTVQYMDMAVINYAVIMGHALHMIHVHVLLVGQVPNVRVQFVLDKQIQQLVMGLTVFVPLQIHVHVLLVGQVHNVKMQFVLDKQIQRLVVDLTEFVLLQTLVHAQILQDQNVKFLYVEDNKIQQHVMGMRGNVLRQLFATVQILHNGVVPYVKMRFVLNYFQLNQLFVQDMELVLLLIIVLVIQDIMEINVKIGIVLAHFTMIVVFVMHMENV
jgi:hypothetical protein